jgi:cytochrome c553
MGIFISKGMKLQIPAGGLVIPLDGSAPPSVTVHVAYAANIEAGKNMATTVCAACHGGGGVSVSDVIPNLAAQRSSYIEAQLRAFIEGTRKQPGGTSRTAIMKAIAAQLSTEDIANVAAYFGSQAGAVPGSKSPLLPNVAKTNVTFPEDYKESFTKYNTISFSATRQVRHYYANAVAIEAAKAGKPLPDGSVLFVEIYAAKLGTDNTPVTADDGSYVADKLLQYSVRAREAGWGQDIPEMLRNADWNYAIFTTDKQYKSGVNQAECLACHKPLNDTSYTFTLKQLSEAK